MRLNPAAFNAHLENMGQNFLWRAASSCPCLNPKSGSPLANCPRCGGKGQTWAKPVAAVAGVANQKTQQQWAKFGEWVSGDMVLSVHESSPMYDMGKFDRVTMLNGNDNFSKVLLHGAPNERILEPVQKFSRVFWLDVDGLTEVDGNLPTVGDNGSLIWSNGGEPPAGKAYSINGTRYSEYYVYGPYPSDRGEHQGARLPKRVVMRNFDMFGRDGKN